MSGRALVTLRTGGNSARPQHGYREQEQALRRHAHGSVAGALEPRWELTHPSRENERGLTLESGIRRVLRAEEVCAGLCKRRFSHRMWVILEAGG